MVYRARFSGSCLRFAEDKRPEMGSGPCRILGERALRAQWSLWKLASDSRRTTRGGGAMTARFVIGDSRQILANMSPDSVDLVMTSPPFWKLRSYLPDDHPDKKNEIGAEPTPGEFVDSLIEVMEA